VDLHGSSPSCPTPPAYLQPTLVWFGIELEGMLCKVDSKKSKELHNLNCFYASDWIPNNNQGARFGVDGRNDTWELATNPHTRVDSLFSDIKTILEPVNKWLPKDSTLLCGPYFSNPNRSGSSERNRNASPCGLHISLSLPEKFNKLYNSTLTQRMKSSGFSVLFHLFILTLFLHKQL
jgi:hypothetical protein